MPLGAKVEEAEKTAQKSESKKKTAVSYGKYINQQKIDRRAFGSFETDGYPRVAER